MTRYFGSAVFEGAEVSDEDYHRLAEQRTDEAWKIRDTRDEEINKIRAVERWAEETITQIREMAQANIDAILKGVTVEPVYEVRGERTACEICAGKIGTIGTMKMLEEKDCVPPFHKNCRCWLEEIGYCVY